MEYWNLYEYSGKRKETKAIRGTKLNNDEFHLVINAWIINEKGEFLITQRSKNKSHPLMWECTGGSAKIGETPIKAAIREVKEELGINVKKEDAVFIGSTRRFYDSCPDILSVWFFKSNAKINEIKIQEEEVNDVMWATPDKIKELFKEGKFEANAFFNKTINFNNKPKIYYVGFNANNAICNENFVDGAITLNPNNEKGNIYYTTEYIKEKNEVFLNEYQNFLIKTMNNLTNKNENIIFLAFNEKIKKLLSNTKDFNIISEKNSLLISNLNNKNYTRNMLKNKIPVINTTLIDKIISYDEAKEIVKSNVFVMQGINGSGGNDTFYINSKEKFEKYCDLCSNNYFLSKYIRHLPVNITIILGKYDKVNLPISTQLIKLEDDRFKYVGADFIYSQKLNKKVIDSINNYSEIIISELKELNYQGILGIDFIVDDNDNVYFMEINPRYQASSFIISKYLEKYCSTSIAELHYLAINDQYLGNNYIDKIDKSFLNCYKKNDFKEFKYFKTVNNGYYKNNKSSYFRKVYDYSILEKGNFQKRENDTK